MSPVENHEYGAIYSHDWDDRVLVSSRDWTDPYIDWAGYEPGFYFVHKEDGPEAGVFSSVDEAITWWEKLL